MPGALPGPQQRVVHQPQRVVPQSIPSPAAAVARGTARPGGGPPTTPGTSAPGTARPGTTAPSTPLPRPPEPPSAPIRAAATGAAPPAVGPPTATPAAARVAGTGSGQRTVADGDEQQAVSQDTMVHPPPGEQDHPPAGSAAEDELEGVERDGHERDETGLEGSRPGADELDEDDAAGTLAAEEEHSEDELGDEDELDYEDELDEDDYHDEAVEPEETGDVPAVAAPAPAPPAPARPQPPPRTPMPTRPPPPPVARPGAPRPQGPILPPYEKSRPDGARWYSRNLASRGGVVAVGATLFLAAAGVFTLLQLGSDDAGEPARQAASGSDSPNGGDSVNGDNGSKRGQGSPVDPRKVTVSVLNGTTVGGLARELGDKLGGQGFRLGNVTNSTDQQRAESVVLFAPGAEREAADVGRRLKIDQREPIDPESQTLAGDASVVVVAGADLDR